MNPDHIGLNGSPTKVVTSFGKMAKGAGELSWTLTPDEAVAAIIAKMEERAHHLMKGRSLVNNEQRFICSSRTERRRNR